MSVTMELIKAGAVPAIAGTIGAASATLALFNASLELNCAGLEGKLSAAFKGAIFPPVVAAVALAGAEVTTLAVKALSLI